MLQFLENAVNEAPQSGGMLGSILMMVALLGVFYFLMIRPENKRKKEAEQMRAAIKVGDKITTIGGIVGTVVDIKNDNIVIETSADQVRMELTKWSVSTNETAAEKAQAEAKKREEAKAKAKAEKRAQKVEKNNR